MFQGKKSAFRIEHANVVRWTHLVDLRNKFGASHQVANANAGQTELAKRAHQQHVGVFTGVSCDHIQKGTAGERLIRFINNHETTRLPRRRDDCLHRVCIPQIGRRVVGIGQVDDCGLQLGNGLQHGNWIKLKIRRQRHANKVQPL